MGLDSVVALLELLDVGGLTSSADLAILSNHLGSAGFQPMPRDTFLPLTRIYNVWYFGASLVKCKLLWVSSSHMYTLPDQIENRIMSSHSSHTDPESYWPLSVACSAASLALWHALGICSEVLVKLHCALRDRHSICSVYCSTLWLDDHFHQHYWESYRTVPRILNLF